MKKIEQKKEGTKSRFRIIYGCVTVGMFCIILIGLGVFYRFIRAYEESQNTYAATRYTASLTREQLCEWIMDAVQENPPVYENIETVIFHYTEALSERDYECCRILSAGTSQNPVFGIYSDNVLIAKITLEQNEKGSFGFSNWNVIHTEICLENFPVSMETYQIYAPLESQICVNGVSVTLSNENAELTEYPFSGQFETANNIQCQCYELSGCFSVPDVSCFLDNIACEQQRDGNAFYFLYPESSLATYTITVPTGSLVTVNGFSVDDSFQSENNIAYAYQTVEQNATPLPTAVTYTIPNLFSVPSVEVSYQEQKLSVVYLSEDCAFRAEYPENAFYTCILTVPQGSSVSMRGVNCDFSKTETLTEAFPALFDSTESSPQYEQYILRGLYLPPEDILVTHQGQKTELLETREGNTFTYTGTFPTCENQSVSELAYTFVQAYFHYTSEGYNHTDENMNNALQYVAAGSDLYKRIARSVESFRFVTPVTSSVYKTLEVQQILQISKNQYVATLVFDIEQKIYYVSRDYAGEIRLYIRHDGETCKVAGMVIDNQ